MLSIKEHIKQTVSLAVPVMIGQLGYIAMGVVDSLLVGRVGPVPLAASALGNGLFILILVVGLGVSYAVSPLVSISAGANKTDEFRKIFQQSFIVNVILSFALFLVSFFSANILFYLNQPPEVAKYAVQYTRILSISIVPLMIFQTYKQFIEGFSLMKPAMIIILMANIVNACIGWILIYGNFGMPRLELNGAGTATLCSRIFMMTVLIFYVANRSDFKKMGIDLKSIKPDFRLIKKILALGLPSGLQYFFEVGSFTAAAIIVGWLGTNALASHQIALNLASITYMAILGISSSSAIRVGGYVGKNDISGTRKAGFVSLALAASLMAVSGLIFILFKDSLPLLYIKNAEVIKITSKLILIAAFFQVFDGTQAVGLGVLRGITDVKIPTVITFIAYWIIALPLAYLFSFPLHMGIEGVWIGISSGLIFSAIMLTFRFHIRSKKTIAA